MLNLTISSSSLANEEILDILSKNIVDYVNLFPNIILENVESYQGILLIQKLIVHLIKMLQFAAFINWVLLRHYYFYISKENRNNRNLRKYKN